MSDAITAEEALAALGFTETEAALYCALLRHGAATGYRCAQLVGKAPPNAYQALSNLAQKGAVLSDDDEPKTWRAARPEELLAGLQKGFEQKRDAALAALTAIERAAPDDRTYQLKSREQVIERALAIIEAARSVLLFDLFPVAFAPLADALEAAAARGVTVAGLTYGDIAAPAGVTALIPPGSARTRRDWPGAQLTLVGDGREHLVALLTRDGRDVIRAAFSDSAYLACLQHSGLSAEIRLAALEAGAPDRLDHLSLLAASPAGLTALTGADD